MSSVNSHTCYDDDDVHVNFDLVGKSNNGNIILRGEIFYMNVKATRYKFFIISIRIFSHYIISSIRGWNTYT